MAIPVNLVVEKWQNNLLVKEKGNLEAYFSRAFWIVMNGRFYHEFLGEDLTRTSQPTKVSIIYWSDL